MTKKFILLTLFAIAFKTSIGQNLSIEETVAYINSTYQSLNPKEPDKLTLSQDGMVTYPK